MTNAILTSGVVLTACRFHYRRLVAPGAIRVLFLALSVACMGAAPLVDAQEIAAPASATERGVKAAFIFKFLSYVEWPPTAFSQADAPIVIGVVGADDIAAELQQITTARAVEGHPLVVRRMREGDSLAGVHVLFMGASEAARLPALVRTAQQRPILTVAEVPGALAHGTIVNFLMIDGRVRFEISVEAAERSGLKLSSRLLGVAQNVRTGP